MQQAGVDEVYITPDSFLVETGEQCGRGSSVKTLVVIKDPHSHDEFPVSLFSGPGVKNK